MCLALWVINSRRWKKEARDVVLIPARVGLYWGLCKKSPSVRPTNPDRWVISPSVDLHVSSVPFPLWLPSITPSSNFPIPRHVLNPGTRKCGHPDHSKLPVVAFTVHCSGRSWSLPMRKLQEKAYIKGLEGRRVQQENQKEWWHKEMKEALP